MRQGRGRGIVQAQTVNLTAADIEALSVTPFQLVPAQGAGTVISLFSVAFVLTAGTSLYQTSGQDELRVRYGTTGTVDLIAQISGIITKFPLQSAFRNSAGIAQNVVGSVGGYANLPVYLLAASPYDEGAIATSVLNAGGSAYAANDTGIFSDGNGDATYKVLTVDGGGAVLTYQITNAGTGYLVENASPTATGGSQPGSGTGFTVDITAVNLGNGLLSVTTYYSVVPVP